MYRKAPSEYTKKLSVVSLDSLNAHSTYTGSFWRTSLDQGDKSTGAVVNSPINFSDGTIRIGPAHCSVWLTASKFTRFSCAKSAKVNAKESGSLLAVTV